MKRTSLIWIAMFAGACAGSPQQPAAAPQAAATPSQPAAPAAPVRTVSAPPAARRAAPVAVDPQQEAALTIPAGAKYTIFCDSFGGPDHVQAATELKNVLIRNTPLRGWYVIHENTRSTLYQGYYTERDPALPNLDRATKADAERARHDKQIVESIPNPQDPGQRLFPRAIVMPLDAPDPDAPPQYNLANADGAWSVQIAAYTGADRKSLAVESVKSARAMNIKAFYFHGPSVSSVCVGTWPEDAVHLGMQGEAKTENSDQDQKLFVDIGETPLSPEEIQKYTGPGGKVRVIQDKDEIVDETLRQTLAQYPEQAVDGNVQMIRIQKKDGQTVTKPRPSMVVRIPRGQAPAGMADRMGRNAGRDGSDPEPSLINPNGGSSNLGARLKGLGQ